MPIIARDRSLKILAKLLSFLFLKKSIRDGVVLGVVVDAEGILAGVVLNDRLKLEEARKRFDKASIAYDQAREKFLSLRKNTKTDVAAAVEEELHAARSSFEKARFSLVTVLSNVEAKKRYEFLEAVSGTMDAHLRFFKQSYELLHQMEPFIHQVLAYAQQSRECSNYEQASLNERMQEFRRQVDRISKQCLNCSVESPKGDSYMRPFSRNAQKDIEAVMQSAQNGKVQTIRQGYLSKRSSNLRGDWKRRFFVLDSRGMLYYYRKPAWPSAGGGQSTVAKCNTSESAPGLLSRLLSSHINGTVQDEKSAARHTLNLLTSTIKVDAEQSDLRFCFRIISPTKVYTLQAENAVDQMDWIEKITGVIASLLSFQTPEQFYSATSFGSADNCSDGGGSPVSLPDAYSTLRGEHTCKNVIGQNHSDLSKILQQESGVKSEKPIEILRRVPGNEICADCGAPEPDWASLNLGILMCITCSGVHRNLGVHISKVRSLTLDVKAWEPSVISLFQSLGNAYANSVWEELLHPSSAFSVNDKAMSSETPDKYKQLLAMRPCPNDSISVKELFIHAKYSEKAFVCKTKDDQHLLSMEQEVQQSVRAGDTKSVYRHIVCSGADVNAIHGQGPYDGNVDKPSSYMESSQTDKDRFGKECAEGCSVLHLACLTAGIDMIELLLQNGADRNAFDYRGRTPLHYCILCGRSAAAKLLLTRGADPLAVDEEGNTALQLASATAMDDDVIAQLTEIIG